MLFVLGTAFAGSPAVLPAPKPGTWSVVSTFESSNCGAPNDTGGTLANQWLVSTKADGTYEVAVQGVTGFPALLGKGQPGKFDLAGIEGAGAFTDANRIVFAAPGNPSALHRLMGIEIKLQADGARWVGTRRVYVVDGPTQAGDKAYFTACVVQWSVVATPG